MQDYPHYKYRPRRKKKNEKGKPESGNGNDNNNQGGTFPLAARGRKDSPKIETVETPESSPNDLAIAAAQAASAASNEYYHDPFAAAAAVASAVAASAAHQSALPTPEISPQDDQIPVSVPSNHGTYTLENNPLVHQYEEHSDHYSRKFYHPQGRLRD